MITCRASLPSTSSEQRLLSSTSSAFSSSASTALAQGLQSGSGMRTSCKGLQCKVGSVTVAMPSQDSLVSQVVLALSKVDVTGSPSALI